MAILTFQGTFTASIAVTRNSHDGRAWKIFSITRLKFFGQDGGKVFLDGATRWVPGGVELGAPSREKTQGTPRPLLSVD